MNNMPDGELDPELQEMARQLDAAFAGTRPRSGFRDELWARLQQPPWWKRLLTGPALWPALGGAVALIVVAVVAGLLLHGGPTDRGSAGSRASAPMSKSDQARDATASSCPTPSPNPTGSPSAKESPVTAQASVPAQASPSPHC